MMKAARMLFLTAWLTGGVSIGAAAQLKDSLPEYIGRINDYEGILTSKEIRSLNAFLMKYEIKTTREVAVLTIHHIPPGQSVNEYAIAVANAWGVGKADTDNGLLIVVSRHSGEARITTGLGTEKALTDGECREVLDEAMIPQFKADRYYKGLMNGLKKLIKYWD